MRQRPSTKQTIFWSGAFLFGIYLAAIPSPRFAHAADVSGKGKNQGKLGDRCTAAADCQKELSCAPAGDHKECSEAPTPPRPIPPT